VASNNAVSPLHHSSSIAAETGCDIGVWLDLSVIQPSPSATQQVRVDSIQSGSRYVAPYSFSLARATFRSRAPPVLP
jgi:hypothetical protein